MTTLMERHMARLEMCEGLERAVYRAGLAWYEPARKAAEAKGRMVQAAQKLAAAESAIRSILREFEGIDRDAGASASTVNRTTLMPRIAGKAISNRRRR